MARVPTQAINLREFRVSIVAEATLSQGDVLRLRLRGLLIDPSHFDLSAKRLAITDSVARPTSRIRTVLGLDLVADAPLCAPVVVA